MNFLHKVSWKLDITKWLLLEEFIIFNYRAERVNSVEQIPLSFNLIYCRINKLRWHDSLCNSALSEESRYEKCTYEVFENKQTRPLFCLKKKLFFFFCKSSFNSDKSIFNLIRFGSQLSASKWNLNKKL